VLIFEGGEEPQLKVFPLRIAIEKFSYHLVGSPMWPFIEKILNQKAPKYYNKMFLCGFFQYI
jgi:hypothetical protein